MIKLSPEVRRLFLPHRDRFGEVLWRDLQHATPEVVASFCDHHFHWEKACRDVAIRLYAHAELHRSIKLDLINVKTVDGQCELSYRYTIEGSRGRKTVVEHEWAGASFGAVAMLLGNADWLYDQVISILDYDA